MRTHHGNGNAFMLLMLICAIRWQSVHTNMFAILTYLLIVYFFLVQCIFIEGYYTPSSPNRSLLALHKSNDITCVYGPTTQRYINKIPFELINANEPCKDTCRFEH